MTEVTIHTECVDDLPLLFGFLQQMGILNLLNLSPSIYENLVVPFDSS